jgi:hypothetical protein
VLRDLPVAELCSRLGYDPAVADRLTRSRDDLVARLLELSRPD